MAGSTFVQAEGRHIDLISLLGDAGRHASVTTSVQSEVVPRRHTCDDRRSVEVGSSENQRL
jgi:hypothetical protein